MTHATADQACIRAWLDRLARDTDQAQHRAAWHAYVHRLQWLWPYSWGNGVLIGLQRPDATVVGAWPTLWEPLGYHIKVDEWENAIHILCRDPCTPRMTCAGADGRLVVEYTTGYVYDVRQVEPGPAARSLAPPWSPLLGSEWHLCRLLIRTARRLQIMIALHPSSGSARGSLPRAGHVVLDGSLGWAERTQALVHALARQVIDAAAAPRHFEPRELACQAEAAQYVLSRALGLPTPHEPAYQAFYGADTQSIMANAHAIQVGVKRLLEALTDVAASSTDVRTA